MQDGIKNIKIIISKNMYFLTNENLLRIALVNKPTEMDKIIEK